MPCAGMESASAHGGWDAGRANRSCRPFASLRGALSSPDLREREAFRDREEGWQWVSAGSVARRVSPVKPSRGISRAASAQVKFLCSFRCVLYFTAYT